LLAFFLDFEQPLLAFLPVEAMGAEIRWQIFFAWEDAVFKYSLKACPLKCLP